MKFTVHWPPDPSHELGGATIPPRPFFDVPNLDHIDRTIKALARESMEGPVKGCDCYDCTAKRAHAAARGWPPWFGDERDRHADGFTPITVEEGKAREQAAALARIDEEDEGWDDEW